MEELIKQINVTLEGIETGYDMGCMISEEFTPSPDYSEVVTLIEASEFTWKQVGEHLKEAAVKNAKVFSDNNVVLHWGNDTYGPQLYTEGDWAETDEGQLIMQLVCIANDNSLGLELLIE